MRYELPFKCGLFWPLFYRYRFYHFMKRMVKLDLYADR